MCIDTKVVSFSVISESCAGNTLSKRRMILPMSTSEKGPRDKKQKGGGLVWSSGVCMISRILFAGVTSKKGQGFRPLGAYLSMGAWKISSR